MKMLIHPVAKSALKAELTSDKFIRKTRKGENEIYILNAHNAPNSVREIGRLREITFRASGGGTGKEIDLDEYDLSEVCYQQLIVWSPEEEEIIGGYRFIKCKDAIDFNGQINLSTTHYFNFSSAFIENYLPYTIELGRSWIQPDYQPTVNPKKGLFALDNIWDGLGALVKFNPEIRYFFGKVTMYPDFDKSSRNFLLTFMHTFFPDTENLLAPFFPLQINEDVSIYRKKIENLPFNEAFKELNSFVREHGEFVPPLFNIYMSLSPTMMTFGTAVNPEFGNVEETGILVTINDIYEEKKERYLNF